MGVFGHSHFLCKNERILNKNNTFVVNINESAQLNRRAGHYAL